VEVVVVGSLNMDTTLRVPRLPGPGETLLGDGRLSDTGGKGANQAVAAARLGRMVGIVGLVGSDPEGEALRRALSDEHVDVTGLGVTAEAPTGVAVIMVDAEGTNQIVVDPGANSLLSADHVEQQAAVLADARVVLAQQEVPEAAVAAAAGLCRGTFVLNPAPARPIGDDLLALVDVLVPNGPELGALSGSTEPTSPAEAMAMAASIEGPDWVIVTLGADGAVLVGDGTSKHFSAPDVSAVDPTAAGDAFCGGLADALVRGSDLEDAVTWAIRCASIAVTRWGAQSSLPTRSEVERAA
jgi:ribokinase